MSRRPGRPPLNRTIDRQTPLRPLGHGLDSPFAQLKLCREILETPHACIALEHAVDDELSSALLAEFPPLEVVAQGTELGSNKRFSLPAADALGDERIAPVWREFVAAHTSQRFLDQLIELFADDIRRLYPSLEQRLGSLDELRAGNRKRDSWDAADVMLDAQISVNTPVTGRPDSVRSWHLDNADKLFAGHFYLRHPDDHSTGGDLELGRFRRGRRGLRGPMIYSTFVERVRTVKYERGTLVLFLNSPDAIHGVTVRSHTDVPRYFLNLVAEVEQPLFAVGDYQARMVDKLLAGPEIAARRVGQLVGR